MIAVYFREKGGALGSYLVDTEDHADAIGAAKQELGRKHTGPVLAVIKGGKHGK